MDRTPVQQAFSGTRRLLPTPWERGAVLGGAALAVGSVLVFLVGWLIADPSAGTHSELPPASARDEWTWRFRQTAVRYALLGTLVAWVGLSSRYLVEHRGVRRAACVTGTCLLALAGVALGLLAYSLLHATCSEGAWLCFSGPEAALISAVPGVVALGLALTLTVGLVRDSRELTALGALGTTAAVVLGAAWFLLRLTLPPY